MPAYEPRIEPANFQTRRTATSDYKLAQTYEKKNALLSVRW